MKIKDLLIRMIGKILKSGKRAPDEATNKQLAQHLKALTRIEEKLDKYDERLTSLVTVTFGQKELILTEVRNCLDEIQGLKSRRRSTSKNDKA